MDLIILVGLADGDGIMDLSQIRNYKLEFSINTDGDAAIINLEQYT